MAAVERRLCEQCNRNRAERFFVSARGRVCTDCQRKNRSAGAHDRRVQEMYGLGPGEYAKLLEAQGGACAICGGSRRERLDVDHDHKTGYIRGLLCKMCNRRLLTAARDSAEILQSAIDYLLEPPAERVLKGVRKAAETENRHGRQNPGGRRRR